MSNSQDQNITPIANLTNEPQNALAVYDNTLLSKQEAVEFLAEIDHGLAAGGVIQLPHTPSEFPITLCPPCFSNEENPMAIFAGHNIVEAHEDQGVICAVASSEETGGVDLTRLAENFKVRDGSGKPVKHTFTQRPAKKSPTATKEVEDDKEEVAAAPKFTSVKRPKAPKVVVARPQLQSEHARGFLREAMRTASLPVDGVDHINTSYCGVTELGQALDINARIPFMHPDLGPFESVGGLWYFLGAVEQDDAFRHLYGKECRARGKGLSMREVVGFKTIIAEATWIKIISNVKLAEAVRDCDLRYRCYYVQGELGVPVRSENEDWYTEVLHQIRVALRLKEETPPNEQGTIFPDFSFLLPRDQERPRSKASRY